jgi:hypothetical protein
MPWWWRDELPYFYFLLRYATLNYFLVGRYIFAGPTFFALISFIIWRCLARCSLSWSSCSSCCCSWSPSAHSPVSRLFRPRRFFADSSSSRASWTPKYSCEIMRKKRPWTFFYTLALQAVLRIQTNLIRIWIRPLLSYRCESGSYCYEVQKLSFYRYKHQWLASVVFRNVLFRNVLVRLCTEF